MPLLETHNVSASYGKIESLKNVTLKVEKNKINCLIGANGAGKTTALKTISGLMRPTSGEILYKDEKISTLSAHQIVKKGISHVPEGRQVFARMSVMENIEMGAFLNADKTVFQRNCQRIWDMFPILQERRHQKAGTLSGGEQQMLAMARGLMADPELLLLDEPSMGLAPMLVEQIFQLIVDINKSGCTIFLVEQNANIALQIGDFGYVLETGSVILEGSCSELRHNDQVRKSYLGE